METLVSQGRILTLAPFCKSFAPVANNWREWLCGCKLSVWACLVNICLCSGKACCADVVQSFSRLSTWRKAALSTSVLWGESSQGETKAQARRLSLSWTAASVWFWVPLGELHQQIHTAWTMQTSPPPAQPFVNRHFDDNSLCRVVPNQYTQSGRLNRHR